MRAVDEALTAALEADATLTGLCPGGVWRARAPEGTPTPYVVFFKAAGTRQYTMGQLFMRTMPYVVKAVCAGWDQEPAQQADERIDALLTDGVLDGDVIAGGRIVNARRMGDIEYVEDDDPGKVFQHVGGTYTVQVAT